MVDSLELYIKISVRNDNGDMIEIASHSEEIHGIGYSNFSSNNMQSSSKSSKKIKKNTEQSKQLQTPDNNYGMFQQSVINTIDNTLSQLQTTSNTVNTIKIDTGVWISLKNDVYMKLQESDLPIEISFIYKGERYRIDIPAGSDLMSLVDENGYCGFLNLMAHFGGTKL